MNINHRVLGEGDFFMGQALLLWLLLPVQSLCEIGEVSADSLRSSKVRNGMKHSDWD